MEMGAWEGHGNEVSFPNPWWLTNQKDHMIFLSNPSHHPYESCQRKLQPKTIQRLRPLRLAILPALPVTKIRVSRSLPSFSKIVANELGYLLMWWQYWTHFCSELSTAPLLKFPVMLSKIKILRPLMYVAGIWGCDAKGEGGLRLWC